MTLADENAVTDLLNRAIDELGVHLDSVSAPSSVAIPRLREELARIRMLTTLVLTEERSGDERLRRPSGLNDAAAAFTAFAARLCANMELSLKPQPKIIRLLRDHLSTVRMFRALVLNEERDDFQRFGQPVSPNASAEPPASSLH